MSLWASLMRKKWSSSINMDRRIRPIRRFFWHFQDDARLLLWTIVLFMLGALFVFFADASMGVFR